jgi:hypothetical protein
MTAGIMAEIWTRCPPNTKRYLLSQLAPLHSVKIQKPKTWTLIAMKNQNLIWRNVTEVWRHYVNQMCESLQLDCSTCAGSNLSHPFEICVLLSLGSQCSEPNTKHTVDHTHNGEQTAAAWHWPQASNMARSLTYLVTVKAYAYVTGCET